MARTVRLDRRAFVVGAAALGTGLTVGVQVRGSGRDVVRASDGAPELTAWIVIRPDDSVVVRMARSEMGQGTLTALAQFVAEELDCDWAKVATEYASPAESLARRRIWGEFSTHASQGLRNSVDEMRRSGAAARLMLIEAAALRWGVSQTSCTTSAGRITHPPTGRSVSYGEVAEAAARLEIPRRIALRDPKSWRIAGKPIKRLDTPPKVTGAQVYGFDVQLPGMLTAVVRDCPVNGGRIASFDAAKALAIKGVRKVVQLDAAAVAVVADGFWPAKTGLEALAIRWDDGPNGRVDSASILASMTEGLDAAEANVGNSAGDVEAALQTAGRRLEAIYATPYQNQAPLEPMNATALVTAERCEVWCPTQDGEGALNAASAASGLPPEQCEVHRLHIGGGFGRRLAQDYVTQAVQVARQMPGTPVKLLWTREEDMARGRYHPAMTARLKGALDAAGRVTALSVRLSGHSIFGIPRDQLVMQGLGPRGDHMFGYDVPNLRVDYVMRNSHLRPGFWRGVYMNQNAIFLECFVDELAAAAGQGPLQFRRAMLDNDPRRRAVVDAVAARVGWETAPPAGIFRGIAQFKAYGSYVAAVAEISVEADGRRVKIHRLVAATDPGHIANPAQVERQVSGSFVYGLSALFLQACTVERGRVVETNFDTYDTLRIAQMPKVETILMPAGGSARWGGVGEPTIAVAAPAVLNAYFAATGKRIRDLPLSRHGIRLV